MMHVGVTLYETLTGFVLGVLLGVAIAVVLWWSGFVSRVAEPYLVVLNSLPKIAGQPAITTVGRAPRPLASWRWPFPSSSRCWRCWRAPVQPTRKALNGAHLRRLSKAPGIHQDRISVQYQHIV